MFLMGVTLGPSPRTKLLNQDSKGKKKKREIRREEYKVFPEGRKKKNRPVCYSYTCILCFYFSYNKSLQLYALHTTHGMNQTNKKENPPHKKLVLPKTKLQGSGNK